MYCTVPVQEGVERVPEAVLRRHHQLVATLTQTDLTTIQLNAEAF